MKDKKISLIKVLRGCGASGVSLLAGSYYEVPAEVSEKDAAILIRLGKAKPASEKPKAESKEPGAGTVEDIKRQLSDLGAEIPSGANKAALLELLEKAKADKAAADKAAGAGGSGGQ